MRVGWNRAVGAGVTRYLSTTASVTALGTAGEAMGSFTLSIALWPLQCSMQSEVCSGSISAQGATECSATARPPVSGLIAGQA